MSKLLLVAVGGAGALGSSFLTLAKQQGYTTVSIDMHSTSDACQSITINDSMSIGEILQQLPTDNFESKVVVCTAGSWSGGTLNSLDLSAADLLYHSNLRPSLMAASIARRLHPCKLVLTSAHASLSACTSMVSYGAVKAAVNHVAESAAAGQVPTLLLLPEVLDTPANRRDMDDSQQQNWTPCKLVAEYALITQVPLPSLLLKVHVCTRNSKTEFKVLN